MNYNLKSTKLFEYPVNVGDYCKLTFTHRDAIEGLWLSVSDTSDGGFTGMLEEDSSINGELHVGSVIEFARRHIHRLMTPDQVQQFGHIVLNHPNHAGNHNAD